MGPIRGRDMAWPNQGRAWFSFSFRVGVKELEQKVLQNRPRGRGVNDVLLPKDPPFFTGGPPHILGSLGLLPEERHLSMPEIGEKERNYLFKSYTDLMT